jgi:hypothetical protein
MSAKNDINLIRFYDQKVSRSPIEVHTPHLDIKFDIILGEIFLAVKSAEQLPLFLWERCRLET